jgi:hypothetical protein
VLKILYTLVGGPLNFEALGFSLLSLLVNPALPMGDERRISELG